MQSKKKRNYLFIVTMTLFIIFAALYFSQKSGFYEYKEYNKMVITEEAMKKFEQDVNEGKDITIEDYLGSTYKDYSTGMSKIGNKTSKFFENLMTGGIKKTFQFIGALFT